MYVCFSIDLIIRAQMGDIDVEEVKRKYEERRRRIALEERQKRREGMNLSDNDDIDEFDDAFISAWQRKKEKVGFLHCSCSRVFRFTEEIF